MKLQRTILTIFAVLIVMYAGTAYAGMQEKRNAFIGDLINAGIFLKVEKLAKYPHLWVKPAFYNLSYDQKSQFVSVVYAYYVTTDKNCDTVLLFDSRSGKKIGVYKKTVGGLKMY